MKQFFFVLLILTVFVNTSHSQVVDTVQTFDYGKMPPVYFSNKVYWERNYNKDNHLLFEALKYNSCFIGAFVNYWNNGKVKTSGQYSEDTTISRKNALSSASCSVQNGEWKNYNETGDLIKTVWYDKGKIVKEY